jgi:hypothetical protein
MVIPRLYEIQAAYGVLEDGLHAERVPPRYGSIIAHMSSVEFASAASDSLLSDPRIYRTRKGYIRLGPFSAQKGDVVIIAAGGKIPFLLRPVGSPEEMKYQLLGKPMCMASCMGKP